MIQFFEEVIKLFIRYDTLFFKGIMNALILSITVTLSALIIGFFLASLRQITILKNDHFLTKIMKHLVRGIVYFYIEFVRGTPMAAQAVFLYYPLRQAIGWTPMVAGYVIVSFNTAAYIAERIRSGIQSMSIPFPVVKNNGLLLLEHFRWSLKSCSLMNRLQHWILKW